MIVVNRQSVLDAWDLAQSQGDEEFRLLLQLQSTDHRTEEAAELLAQVLRIFGEVERCPELQELGDMQPILVRAVAQGPGRFVFACVADDRLDLDVLSDALERLSKAVTWTGVVQPLGVAASPPGVRGSDLIAEKHLRLTFAANLKANDVGRLEPTWVESPEFRLVLASLLAVIADNWRGTIVQLAGGCAVEVSRDSLDVVMDANLGNNMTVQYILWDQVSQVVFGFPSTGLAYIHIFREPQMIADDVALLISLGRGQVEWCDWVSIAAPPVQPLSIGGPHDRPVVGGRSVPRASQKAPLGRPVLPDCYIWSILSSGHVGRLDEARDWSINSRPDGYAELAPRYLWNGNEELSVDALTRGLIEHEGWVAIANQIEVLMRRA